MKRILPILLLVIGAVCYFLFRPDEADEYGYGDDSFEENRYEDDGGALNGNPLGNG